MNHKDKDSIMRISPISSYKSNPQRFTGAENPITRRQFIQTAGTVAAGAVLAPAAIAQTQPKRHLFDYQEFKLNIFEDKWVDPKYHKLSGKQTLELFVCNKLGEKDGFTEILALLQDDTTKKEILGEVGYLLDAPHEGRERVMLFDFDEKLFFNTSNKDIFKFVTKYVSLDSKFDLSNIFIVTLENGKTKTLRGIRNLR